MLRIVDPGWATTIQDDGRRGFAHLGVPTAGAVDRRAQALANRLVGNDEASAVLEAARGLVVEAVRPLIVATAPDGTRYTLQSGERLAVDAAPDSMWVYLAVRGGIEVPRVLGSMSHDTLSGLGPGPLLAGTVLDIGADPHTELVADHAPSHQRDRTIRVWPGPHGDTFRDGLGGLVGPTWSVSSDVSRVAIRLTAGEFPRSGTAHEQMPSEGLVEGAVQITPSGEPVVMLANHPTTGGYPVVAVVDPDDIGIIAQSPPGSIIRFRRT